MKRVIDYIFVCLNAIIMAAASTVMSFSKPYNPVPVNILQSDNTNLTVTYHGDEHFSYVTTEDGILLYDSLGVYYYSAENASCSDIKAKNPSDRNKSEIIFIESIDQTKAITSKLNKDGYKEYGNKTTSLRASASDRPVPSALTQGEHRFIVIPLSQPSKKIKFTTEEISNHYNQEGYSRWGNNGSVRDYYLAQSKGKFNPHFDVYPTVQLSKNLSAYSDDYDIMTEALSRIRIKNIEQYDADKDGVIDGVILITAGSTKDNGGHGIYKSGDYWNRIGTKKVGDYIITTELSESDQNVMDGTGSVIHEFGHMLGLKDLYPVGINGDIRTPKYWDVMDIGCYNGSTSSAYGLCVPNFSAFELQSLGWLEPEVIEIDDKSAFNLPPITEGIAYEVRCDKDNEWFLIENRQKEGWDKELPGHGMLVWHIDYNSSVWRSGKVNNISDHQYVDIVEAFAANNVYYGLGSYPYPGTRKESFFYRFIDWAGKYYDMSLNYITESDRNICFSTSSSLTINECPCADKHYTPETTIELVSGSDSLEVYENSSIDEIVYQWSNADEIRIEGLPSDLYYWTDSYNRKIVINGTVSSIYGSYEYTIIALKNGIPVKEYVGNITILPEVVTLEIENGKSKTYVEKNTDIEPLSFVWDNADEIVVSGLPEGLQYRTDYSNKRTIINGFVTADYGKYDYTVQALKRGTVYNEFVGQITVVADIYTKPGSLVIVNGETEIVVKRNTEIAPLEFVWENEDDIVLFGLPEGLYYNIDYDNQRVTILGEVTAQEGEYEYILEAIKGDVQDITFTGRIVVTGSSSLDKMTEDETIVSKEYYRIDGSALPSLNGIVIVRYITNKGNVYYTKERPSVSYK